MARKPSGSVQYRNGKWWGRITCQDGSRPWLPEPLGSWPNSPQGRARAAESCAHWSEVARAKGVVGVPRRASLPVPTKTGETVAEYAQRWLDDRERRGLASVATDRARMRVHVLPSFVGQMMGAVELHDVRAVVEALDDKVRAGGVGWNTAKKAWGLVTKMFSDSCKSKVAALRVRTTNPALGVQGPDKGEKKLKQWLYPDEAAALLACSDVPVRWRRMYALAIYTYVRPGELAALEWRDVHDDQAYVLVHQSLDTRAEKLKGTKTGVTRKVPIPPALAPLLTRMRLEAGNTGRVLQSEHVNKRHDHGMPPLEDLAATLREHLTRAGCTRADLTVPRPTTKVMTFYDLRATGITWEVLAKTEALAIMYRAGHKNLSTTQIYIREAEMLGQSVGIPFGPLPAELCGPVQDGQSSSQSSTRSPVLTTLAPKAGNSAARVGRQVASPRGFEPLLQP